jgi:hypothetical protein
MNTSEIVKPDSAETDHSGAAAAGFTPHPSSPRTFP